MSTTAPKATFQKFDFALSQLDWSPFTINFRPGYERNERIYQVAECEFRVKETAQGFTDSYGLTNYLKPDENPEDPETLHGLRDKILQRLEESHKVHLITHDSQRRTMLL